MSSLNNNEKRKFEALFGMSSGYVLGFSDRTFGEFFIEQANIDIHGEKYQEEGTSKAKKLRTFWRLEPDPVVGNVLLALIERAHEASDSQNDGLLADCRQIAHRLLYGALNLDPLKSVAEEFDSRHLAQQISRIQQAVDIDPDLAIGTAKELVESCCKTILAERGKPVAGTPDIPTLTKNTLKELKLVPEGIPEEARGKDVIRRILSNLGTIGNGLAELRGLYGTGHGRDGKAAGLSTRHARLAVGAAVTLVLFLFETHAETEMKNK